MLQVGKVLLVHIKVDIPQNVIGRRIVGLRRREQRRRDVVLDVEDLRGPRHAVFLARRKRELGLGDMRFGKLAAHEVYEDEEPDEHNEAKERGLPLLAAVVLLLRSVHLGSLARVLRPEAVDARAPAVAAARGGVLVKGRVPAKEKAEYLVGVDFVLVPECKAATAVKGLLELGVRCPWLAGVEPVGVVEFPLLLVAQAPVRLSEF